MAVEVEIGFEFELEDRPGALGEVTRSLADANVNIGGICGVSAGGRGVGIIILDDPDAGRRALEDAGARIEEVELVTVDIPDRPGELNRRLEGLAGENINLRGVCPLAEAARIAFAVDNVQRAVELLEGVPAAR